MSANSPLRSSHSFSYYAVDRHARHTQRSPDFSRTLAFGKKTSDALPIDTGLAACVDASLLGFRDPLGLAVPTHVCFELGEHRQHSKEGSTGRCGGVNALLDDTQMRSSMNSAICHSHNQEANCYST